MSQMDVLYYKLTKNRERGISIPPPAEIIERHAEGVGQLDRRIDGAGVALFDFLYRAARNAGQRNERGDGQALFDADCFKIHGDVLS